MSSAIEIQPVNQPIRASIRPPGSKSLSNRALVCAALASGESTLGDALASEDTQMMIDGLRALGIAIDSRDDGRQLVVNGCSGKLPATNADLFVGNSGTTMRFLTALATLGTGEFRLDGVDRMRERPIGDLVDALGHLGAKVVCEGPGRCPPVRVTAAGLPGGRSKIRGDVSSQFLSGLLMAAPCAKAPVRVVINGPLVSVPYVRMTVEVMRSFGAAVECDDEYREINVQNDSGYSGRHYMIEPDASAASYFFAAAAVTGGQVTVEGLGLDSLQGDVAFTNCLAQMGCEVRVEDHRMTVVGRRLSGIDVDMNAISDTVQTLAVVALFADGPTRIANIGHVRHKETDRIAALATELRKLGAVVDEGGDFLTIAPGIIQSATIDTYSDHRMAMSFAIAGLRVPGIKINDPGCTAKTYPGFFQDLAMLQ